MGAITVIAEELNYIDRAANSGKFYRVFSWGTTAVVQYGRGGTAGTFKRTTCATDEVALADVAGDNIMVLPYAAGTDAKRAALAEATDQNREGIMFRNTRSAYQPGRRSQDLLKHKFVRELDVFVTKLATKAGKQNAEMAVYDDDDGRPVILGAVSTIGKGDIAAGDVAEIRYLYTVGGSTKLFQPRIVRKRSEKSAAECSIRQLEGSATNKTI